MDFLETFGVDPEIFLYVILPILIFCARIIDVSIATLRMIFVMSGRKYLAPVLGFFESLIWLLAISQIFQNVNNVISFVAFAGGFATGTFVGMLIEEKLALGNVVVRVITNKDASDLVDHFRSRKFYCTNIAAEGREGKVNILFMVVRRNKLQKVLNIIMQFNPKAFYTVESVRMVRDENIQVTSSKTEGFRFLSLKRR